MILNWDIRGSHTWDVTLHVCEELSGGQTQCTPTHSKTMEVNQGKPSLKTLLISRISWFDLVARISTRTFSSVPRPCWSRANAWSEWFKDNSYSRVKLSSFDPTCYTGFENISQNWCVQKKQQQGTRDQVCQIQQAFTSSLCILLIYTQNCAEASPEQNSLLVEQQSHTVLANKPLIFTFV